MACAMARAGRAERAAVPLRAGRRRHAEEWRRAGDGEWRRPGRGVEEARGSSGGRGEECGARLGESEEGMSARMSEEGECRPSDRGGDGRRIGARADR